MLCRVKNLLVTTPLEGRQEHIDQKVSLANEDLLVDHPAEGPAAWGAPKVNSLWARYFVSKEAVA